MAHVNCKDTNNIEFRTQNVMGTLFQDIYIYIFFHQKKWTIDLLKITICEQGASGVHCFILSERQKRHASCVLI
jgi:hypothetical protein